MKRGFSILGTFLCLADIAFFAFVAILALGIVVLAFRGCSGRDCECDCYMYGRTFDDGVRQCVIGITQLEERVDAIEATVIELENERGSEEAMK